MAELLLHRQRQSKETRIAFMSHKQCWYVMYAQYIHLSIYVYNKEAKSFNFYGFFSTSMTM